MDPLLAMAVVLALVAGATAGGLVWRRRDGRSRTVDGPAIGYADLGIASDGGPVFGEHATLIQFSTEMCARCPAARRLLGAIADTRPGVRHMEVDLTHLPEVASRFGILQTPTTLVLDAGGRQIARISGAPTRAGVEGVLDRLSQAPTQPLASDPGGPR